MKCVFPSRACGGRLGATVRNLASNQEHRRELQIGVGKEFLADLCIVRTCFGNRVKLLLSFMHAPARQILKRTPQIMVEGVIRFIS